MEISENKLWIFNNDKKGLIADISKLEEGKIIKLAKVLGDKNVEGPEEALKSVTDSIKNAKDQDDFQTIQRKYHNLDDIEI